MESTSPHGLQFPQETDTGTALSGTGVASKAETNELERRVIVKATGADQSIKSKDEAQRLQVSSAESAQYSSKDVETRPADAQDTETIREVAWESANACAGAEAHAGLKKRSTGNKQSGRTTSEQSAVNCDVRLERRADGAMESTSPHGLQFPQETDTGTVLRGMVLAWEAENKAVHQRILDEFDRSFEKIMEQHSKRAPSSATAAPKGLEKHAGRQVESGEGSALLSKTNNDNGGVAAGVGSPTAGKGLSPPLLSVHQHSLRPLQTVLK
jgi:hypothetical protein